MLVLLLSFALGIRAWSYSNGFYCQELNVRYHDGDIC